ncbi:MAG: pitrilysin family protein [Terrimicrobiaceae bacterium]
MKTQLTELPGGLRVATCEMPHATTAAMAIWANVGGRHEPARLNGISHFIEHLLFKGTARRSARRIMEEVEGVGGDLNAFTSEERTCYYAAAAAEFFPRICDVLCDLYLSPRLAPIDIERERGVIVEEIQMYRDEPSSHVQEMLNSEFWKSHPLGRPITGTIQTVTSLTRDDIQDYRREHYQARRTVVSAAGKIRHEDVVERVSRLLEGLPSGRKAGVPRPPRLVGRAGWVVEKRDTQQTQVAIGFPAPSQKDSRRFAVHLLHVLLGGNASSRLFQQLREKRGLCYSVSTHPNLLADGGMLNLSLGLDARNLQKSLQLILLEIDKIRKQPPGAAEFRRAKEYAVGSSRMSLERASTQNMRAGSSVLVYGKIIDPEEVHAQIRAVDAEAVSSVARDFLDPSKASIAIIGPDPQEDAVRKIFS